MRTVKYITAIVVLLGFLGYVCYDIFFPNGFDDYDEEAKKATKKTALTIGAPNNISSLPIWIAEEDSLFHKYNVDITVKDYTDQLDCDMAFASGKINMEITDPERADWLKIEKKQVFSELHKLPMPYALVASHSARLTSMTQLKNKLIAHSRHSIYSYALNHCLDSIKMKRDSAYVMQINNPNVAMLMLHNAELDASFMPEPFVSLAKSMGHKPLYKNYTQAQLIAKSSIKSDDLKRFNKAYAEALKLIRTNGVKHYTALIARHCKCSPQFDKELKIKF
ncbi:MAG: ABC transporter substrate-binding protein [Prevotella sp.]|nr:ABC transporter substrate-binding protein [Prevotella sp.]